MEHRTSNPQLLAQMNSSESDQAHDSETMRVDHEDALEARDSLQSNEKIILEPVEQNPYEMSYTCLLLARLDSHSLLGDVALGVQTSLKQICASFGWSLEFLNIEPTYLHWTIRVPPATSTAHIIQVVREKTSVQLFADFPHLKHENESNDFWAPGYLIFWGSQPHPIEIIQRFIRQTRQQQGIGIDE